MSQKMALLEARVVKLERRSRLLEVIAFTVVVVGTLGSMRGLNDAARASSPASDETRIIDNLRVRSLEVVDINGITRVRLGAPVPNAKRDGKVLTRGGTTDNTVSGILLYDYAGRERSGYVTNDQGYSNVLLTLDDATGQQHALFISEPEGATTLRLFNGVDSRADVYVTKDGPRIRLLKNGKLVLEKP